MFKNIVICICVVFKMSFAIADAEPIKIKIGASLPMSGDLAYVGVDILRGLELAKKDFDSDKVKYEIIVEDDSYLGKNAATAGIKLLNIDKVDAIISLWDMAEIIAPIAEKSEVPHFAIRWNPHIAEKYSYTMTIESTYISYVNSWVDLLKDMRIKSVSIIREEVEGWNLGADLMKTLLLKEDIKLNEEIVYLRSESDHRTIIMKVLRKKPEMVLFLTNPPHNEIFIKRLKEANPEQRFSGYFEIMDNIGLVENMPFVAQLEPAPWFIKKFEDSYHQKIAARAPQSYDIVAVINDSLGGHTGKPTGGQIVSHISAIHDFPGASGMLNSKGLRTVEMSCVWKAAKDGTFVRYSPAK